VVESVVFCLLGGGVGVGRSCFDYIPIKYSRSVDPVFSLLVALVSDFR